MVPFKFYFNKYMIETDGASLRKHNVERKEMERDMIDG